MALKDQILANLGTFKGLKFGQGSDYAYSFLGARLELLENLVVVVRDQWGNLIEGATVQITPEGGATQTFTTDGEGVVDGVFPEGLAITVTASKAGYATSAPITRTIQPTATVLIQPQLGQTGFVLFLYQN
jgi:hypothetical protein